ncbi:MAG: YifB family Mg chelatase-like AAA ATPase [Mogibacterium sp.]|nr:YifB family Mg chelatase-like AAA ATPase [Mogibacterium sp.]MBR2540667.1 YifB family Mg chelatase-like AAA ATPase [Mogibacterium sp.]
MFSRIRSAVCSGIEGRDIYVETDVARGLPGIYIVGLASTTIMESRERIKSAILNSGLDYPRGRITVNLTPASLRKNGSCLDLPIAVGILTSNMYLDAGMAGTYGIVGELALDGRVLGVRGILPMLIRMKESGIMRVIIPGQNMSEAVLVDGLAIFPVESLAECVDIISGRTDPEPYYSRGIEEELPRQQSEDTEEEIGDYADINGQENAKRAAAIAVAGRHGIILIGSPGCGKTMISSRIPTIMPPMSASEILDTSIIYSASRGCDPGRALILRRPFRSPHHTIGRSGLIGGGTYPVPGEISLAHNGVLFLDEVCEFDRECIEALRLPIEERQITHFRMGESYTFPCSFQLVMASNPCPCGYFGDSERVCKCTEAQLERYRKKLSGPIMDRIDMRVNMERVTYDELTHEEKGLSSADMKRMIDEGVSFARASGRSSFNALLSEQEIEKYCSLGADEEAFMKRAYSALKMSPRSYKKTLKVARTIADIDKSDDIRTRHLAEALSYRITEDLGE